MSLSIQLLIGFFLLLGGGFVLIGAIGLVRFPDFYMRLHAPTKATTLGVGSLLVACVCLESSRGQFSLIEVLITLFLFMTAPVSAHLLAQAALHCRTPSAAPSPPTPTPTPTD
jgi:multicomponent K+:H+ antiporter subunit G